MIDVEKAGARLERVVEAMRGGERFLIQAHNNPDPDSIASAVTLRYLVQRYTGRDAVIAFGGLVGRSENRAMVRYLNIPLVPGSLVDYHSYDFTGVCDTQPGTNYTSFPEGFVPTVVIDHHPKRPATNLSPVVILEAEYGATSTIVAEMLLAKGLPIPGDVATALYYGITSETQDLCRETGPVDVAVYRELEKLVDREILSRIESEQVPPVYFAEVSAAIRNAKVHGDVVVTDLGPVRVPDMVAEMADFLLRLENMRWSVVMGEHEHTLYLSLRAKEAQAYAGAVMLEAVTDLGSGGGHPTMAGGQVPMVDLSPERKAEVREKVLRKILRLSGAAHVEPTPLVSEEQLRRGDQTDDL
jgi:nanoRNase/pAp phosphatase (c-di-AMP/oligoRNAs hydrolase)